MADTKERSPIEAAHRRSEDLRAFVWHLVAYVLANGFIFAQDAITGDGIEWAYWVAVPWGIGLLVHAVAVFLTSRGKPV